MTFALAQDSSLNTLSLAANIYYSGYERSQTSDDQQRHAQLAKMTLEKVLAKDESDLSLMCKLAMIEVNSNNPMTGIMKLRQVLEIDPNYREAVMDLGILAMQSGQWDKAKGRFEQLLGQDANDQEARLNLGVCYMESGQDSLAIEMLGDVVADQYADPAVATAAQEYLKVLNN
jgi:Flp pilus assembly protein TadD